MLIATCDSCGATAPTTGGAEAELPDGWKWRLVHRRRPVLYCTACTEQQDARVRDFCARLYVTNWRHSWGEA